MVGSVATTAARAWSWPLSVRMRTPSPLLRVTPSTSTPCSTGRSRLSASWLGSACMPRAGSAGMPQTQRPHAEHRELVGRPQVLVGEHQPEEGRSTSSRIRPEMPWRSSDSASVMSAPARSRSSVFRNGSVHRSSRAMSWGWPSPERMVAIRAACDPCRMR